MGNIVAEQKDTLFDKTKFIQDYTVEAKENLANLDELCIKINKNNRDEDSLKEILRILHTLKGTSRIMEFFQIEQIVHKTESVFKQIQNNHFEITKNHLTLLINIISILKNAVSSIEKNNSENIPGFDFIIENIQKAFSGEEFIPDFQPECIQKNTSETEEILFHDSDTIKIQISEINNILQSFDKLIMRQIRLKNEILHIKKQIGQFGFDNFHELDENLDVLEKQTFDIQEEIISLRMLPFNMILQPLKHAVLSEVINLDKKIELDIPGSEITIDKTILEKLPKILLHLIRNAIDHGIESSRERIKLGKNPTGCVGVSITQKSNRIFITVSDDGGGMDYKKICSKAKQVHPERAKEIQKMTDDELIQFIFESGFSTKEQVTELSGRGIGLDVVRSEMDHLKGKISITSKPGTGTSVELSLPASLTTQDGLFIRQGKNNYLILSHYIKEILTVSKNSFLNLQKGPVLNLHNELLPVYDFDAVIGTTLGTNTNITEIPVVVLEYLNTKIVVMVDEILHYKTVVIKPVPALLKKFEGLQGLVFDENYRIIPVLNIPNCIQRFKNVTSYNVKELQAKKQNKIYSILVVDDSHTTRNIEKIILESENYKVVTACDGIDALEKLKSYNFDLVVTDIKMPRMDGFDLLHNIRHTDNLKNIPVIVISSVYEADTEQKIKNHGGQGYIIKSDFERENLIAKVKELLVS